MLQRAASNAYSWWWASHIRTKQSKWLDTDLEEMGERMQSMIKIIDEEGDSFARKAEMYFKKRPELLESVEQTYKAYRALAEKYDHISSELHKANHTIATAFPDQIEFDMQDEDCASLNLGKAISSGKLGKPSAGLPRIGMPKKETKPSALKKSRLARVASQRSKAKAQDEIDKLQKGILVLQTEKEYIRSSYEIGVAKYSDIERQITEMQEDVFSLQDAYSANVVIEDDAARTLMTATALRSCESSLAKLQEQQQRVMEETKIEMERVKIAKEKIQSGGESSEEVTHEEESMEPESLCEHIEISSDVSVEELAEKINELVSKVISYEMSASSQTAQMKRMSAEIDVLHRYLLSSDEDKRALMNEVNSLRDKLQQAQEDLKRMQQAEEELKTELKRMQQAEEELKTELKRMQQAQEELKRMQELKERVIAEEAIPIQKGKDVPSISVTVEEAISAKNEKADSSTSVADNEAISVQNEKAGPSTNVTDKEAIALQNEKAGPSTSVTDKEASSVQNEKAGPSPIEHSEAEDGSKQAQVTQVVKQGVEISSSQSVDHVELSNASKLQLETNQLEFSSGFEDNWTRFEETEEEVKITSQDSIHRSKKFSPQLKKPVGHSEVKNPSKESKLQVDENVKARSLKSQVAEQEDRIHGNAQTPNESKLQFEEDPDASLNSLQSLVNKLEGKEKIILTELESTLRNYKETKKKLSVIEKQNQEHNIEINKQIRELKSSNAMKDAEIHTLKKNLRSLQLKSTETARISDPLIFESKPRKATSFEDNFDPHTISVIEERFRRDINTVLEENLEFWLRFNSSSQNRQFFQTTFEDIQAEIDSLKLNKSGGEGSNHKKLGGEGSNHKKSGGEGSNHSTAGKQANLESLLIDRKLKELKTEIHVWLEQNALLQGELESKYSSLGSIQEEISATLEASLEGNIEEEGVVFAPYQAAKFQGELLNIQLENNKVSEELKAGMEDARELQAEIESALARLHGKRLPEAPESGDGSNQDPLRHSSTRNQVPLRSFLFTQKPKRRSMFSKVNPALQKRMAGRGRSTS